MPATTRSANQKQTSFEDVGAGKVKADKSKVANTSKKRKAEDKPADKKLTKTSKKSSGNDDGDNIQDSESITINRAPVLELWAGTVTQFLYPSLSWATCLSAGGAIATITAISKGRSIGTIEKRNPEEAEKKRQERKKKAEKDDLEDLEVMSFKLSLKDGQAQVGGKPKKASEEALRKKYGGPEQYEKTKAAFEEALKSWKGRESELDQRAFHMYEDFRPSIPAGQAGWGRKGQLNLETVKSAVAG